MKNQPRLNDAGVVIHQQRAAGDIFAYVVELILAYCPFAVHEQFAVVSLCERVLGDLLVG